MGRSRTRKAEDGLSICGTSILGGWAPLPKKRQVKLRSELLGGATDEPGGPASPFTLYTARSEVSRWVESLARETNALRANKLFRAWCETTAGLWEYSPLNRCLVKHQRKGARFIAGRSEWERRNRNVIPGSQPIWILAPSHGAGARFVMVKVYDVRDTLGAPLVAPSWRTHGPSNRLALIEKTAAHLGFSLREVRSNGVHLGRCDGKIIMLDRALGGAERFLTLAHELGHGLLHTVEAGRRVLEKQAELEAEATAYVVAKVLGQRSTAPEYFVGMGLSPEALKRSLGEITRAVQTILRAASAVTAETRRSRTSGNGTGDRAAGRNRRTLTELMDKARR